MFLTHETPESRHAEFASRSTMSGSPKLPRLFARFADILAASGPAWPANRATPSEGFAPTFVDLRTRPARQGGDAFGLTAGGDL